MSLIGNTDGVRKARASRAFTLIEVLVVVAIIALLVSVLMPALSSAKRQARKVVCASNLHTIGQAIMFYAQASKDEVPAGYAIDKKTGKPAIDINGNTSISSETFEFLYPFVQKVGVKEGKLVSGATGPELEIPTYSCPEDRKQHTTESKRYKTQKVEIGLSYGVNSSMLAEKNGSARKISSVKNTSSLVTYLDAGDDQRAGDTGWVLADGAADFLSNQCFFELRHHTGSQFLYLDGHVSFSQAMHLGKPKITNDRENYGLPPYPAAFIPNWGPKSPNFSTKDAQGHAAPVRTAIECGPDC